MRYTPLTTRHHARMGTRERVLETAQKYPDSLRVELDALVTRVLFDEHNRAIGVEYLSGEKLYRAHAAPSTEPGERAALFASREVILAGGAFNTPQLLMLSGIGPRAMLDRLGIPVRIDLAAVGRNLQDRYEVGVVHRMNFDRWTAYKAPPSPEATPRCREWADGRGPLHHQWVGTDGLPRSRLGRRFRITSALRCLAFRRVCPSYSSLAVQAQLSHLGVLKAHTATVRARSCCARRSSRYSADRLPLLSGGRRRGRRGRQRSSTASASFGA